MRSHPTTIRLLGPIVAARADHEIHIGPSRERECLAVLALRRGAPVSVTQLIDDLWGEDAPASAVNVVHTYISRLRGRLGSAGQRDRPLLRSHHPGYSIDTAVADVDLDGFEADRSTGMAALWAGQFDLARASLHGALGRWSGQTALHGATGPMAIRERRRLAELHLDTVEHLITLRMRGGERLDAIAELSTLVRQHPFRERLWVLLMLALTNADRRGEALLTYHDLRRCLNDDLGINPSHRAQRLFSDLLSDKPPAEVWATHFDLATPSR